MEQVMADLRSGNHLAVVEAATSMLARGEYGEPAGSVPLAGGKAALKIGRLADAVVLLYHGLRVAEPNSLLWAELLVNRAVACAQHGFYDDAIKAATTFLDNLHSLPEEAAGWLPYVHHALGLAYDRLGQYDKAIPHHRFAAETYASDPVARVIAVTDLAYSLALSGKPEEARHVLLSMSVADDPHAKFVLAGTTAIVHCCRGEFREALSAAEEAEALVAGQEEAWAIPLAEVRYWAARAAWSIGDGYRAGLLALRAAVVADQRWQLKLSDDATSLLQEIMGKGGVQHA